MFKTGELILDHGPEQKFRFELAPVVGDAIHNLRTALDLTWYEFLDHHAPAAISDHTSFPVRKTRQGVIAALGNAEIKRLGSRLFDLIVSDLQPYKGGQGEIIYSLHELDIRDKHMLLLPIFEVATITMDIEDDRQNVSEFYVIRTRGREISPTRFPPGYKLKDKGKPSINVVFDKGVPMHTEPIVPALRRFVKTTRGIVERFETY